MKKLFFISVLVIIIIILAIWIFFYFQCSSKLIIINKSGKPIRELCITLNDTYVFKNISPCEIRMKRFNVSKDSDFEISGVFDDGSKIEYWKGGYVTRNAGDEYNITITKNGTVTLKQK